MKLLGHSFARALLLACALLVVWAVPASADYEQGFDSLADSGWSSIDMGSSGKPLGWVQGVPNGEIYSAHSGAPDSFVQEWTYLYPNAGAASNWLISPKFESISNGDVITFFMRQRWVWLNTPDALELRVSTNGGCSPGDGPASVGDFKKVLIALNPSSDSGPYTSEEFTSHSIHPKWTKHAAAISGLPNGTHSGCYALWAGVRTGGGLISVGVDDFSIAEDAARQGDVEFFPPFANGFVRGTVVLGRGRADIGTNVSFFDNPTCDGDPYRTFAAAQFEWPGVDLPIKVNEVTELSAQSVDESGLAGDCVKYPGALQSDTTPPATTDDFENITTNAPRPLRLTATDDRSGVAKTYYMFGYPTVLGAGEKHGYDPDSPPTIRPGDVISYHSVDAAGNQEGFKSVYFPWGLPDPPPAPEEGPDAPVVVTESSSESPSARARVSSRPAYVRGRSAGVVVICMGAARATGCSGTLAISSKLGSSPAKLIAPSTSFRIPVNERLVVPLKLTSVAREYFSQHPGRSPWAEIRMISPNAWARGSSTYTRKLVRR